MDRLQDLNRAERRSMKGGRKDRSVVYAADGTRIGCTVFHSKTGLNSAKVCDTPALADISDYSDLRGSCEHPEEVPVIVSAWSDGGIWWPSIMCTSCRQITGRRDPYFSIEGDLITVERGTNLMQAEWQFWRMSGWPRVGKPRFDVEAPGKRLGLPPLMWVDPYRLFTGWGRVDADIWTHPLLDTSLVLRRRDSTPEDQEYISISAEVVGSNLAAAAADDNVVKLRDPKVEWPDVWQFLIDRRGTEQFEESIPFSTREDALEAALCVVFDMQAALAMRMTAMLQKQRAEQKPEVILPPGVS